jgi:3-phytase
MMKTFALAASLTASFALFSAENASLQAAPLPPRDLTIQPLVKTAAVTDDADDPAIWIHPTDPSQSVIIGTNKNAAPTGALVVFGLDGSIKQTIAGLDRPNNVDIETGFDLGGKPGDIAVTTERNRKCLRIFAIENGVLRDLAPAGLPVFVGQEGENAAPMGISLYKRPRDGAIFAIVGRKTGPSQGYLWQYRLSSDAAGRVTAEKVREFGNFSMKGEIEAVAVDDELGTVYYSDEGLGIRKWAADPDDPRAARELALFGVDTDDKFGGDREGIAIVKTAPGRGYILVSEQMPLENGQGGTVYRLYPREGTVQNPDDHSQLLAKLHGGADSTDGLEVVTTPLGANFPNGALVVMNSAGRNFWIYDWRAIERGLIKP